MTETAQQRSRLSWAGQLLASLALAAFVLFLAAIWWNEARAYERSSSVVPDSIGAGPLASSESLAIFRTTSEALAWRPLAQPALNRFLVAASLRGDDRLVGQIADLMERFAWRTTAGQLNLIALHLEAEEYSQAFVHGDALLRRGVAEEQVYALFLKYEQIPAERLRLVERLVESPPWRRAYLASAERLVTASEIEARYATIHRILTLGPVQRDELSSLLLRMMVVGAAREAYDLWRMAERHPARENGVADGDFRHAAALQEAGLIVRYPFEWELDTSPGSGASAIRDGSSSYLEVYWNGQGSPVFAKQSIKADPGRFQLVMQNVRGSTQARRAIGAELVCPNAERIRFRPVSAADREQLVFETAEPTTCDFPQMQLVGVPGASQGEMALTLSGIKLHALP